MLKEAINFTALNQCNPGAHENLAMEYMKLGRNMPAVAELRTCMALGGICGAGVVGRMGGAGGTCGMVYTGGPSGSAGKSLYSEQKHKDIISQLTRHCNIQAYSHNTYYRLKTISDHLKNLYGRDNFSVLDIGGGEGDLCLFLPRAGYALAEPTINGISALDLKFENKSFDCVVAVHVLEHIPIAKREEFLDSLCAKARNHVVLLNPFESKHSGAIEKLAYELTGEEWAREHMECKLPCICDIEKYTAGRKIKYRAIPNGSQLLTASVVFLDYFAGVSGRQLDWLKVNQLLNSCSFAGIDNASLPNAWLIELEV